MGVSADVEHKRETPGPTVTAGGSLRLNHDCPLDDRPGRLRSLSNQSVLRQAAYDSFCSAEAERPAASSSKNATTLVSVPSMRFTAVERPRGASLSRV